MQLLFVMCDTFTLLFECSLLRHCVLFCMQLFFKLCDTFTPLFQCSLLISVLQVMRSPVRLCDLFCMQLFFIMCDTSTLLFQCSLLISVLHFSFQVMSSEVLYIVTYAADMYVAQRVQKIIIIVK
jgi:hypothetical protein